jgi:hypothetical protein
MVEVYLLHGVRFFLIRRIWRAVRSPGLAKRGSSLAKQIRELASVHLTAWLEGGIVPGHGLRESDPSISRANADTWVLGVGYQRGFARPQRARQPCRVCGDRRDQEQIPSQKLDGQAGHRRECSKPTQDPLRGPGPFHPEQVTGWLRGLRNLRVVLRDRPERRP